MPVSSFGSQAETKNVDIAQAQAVSQQTAGDSICRLLRLLRIHCPTVSVVRRGVSGQHATSRASRARPTPRIWLDGSVTERESGKYAISRGIRCSS